jgi:protein TonB
MNSSARDVNGGTRRLVLALLLALGLHAALLFIPADWRTFQLPTPHRFEVRLLPAITPPRDSESTAGPESEPALLPLEPALLTLLEAAVEVKPVPPVMLPKPVIAIKPAPKRLAPARSPAPAKPAPAPRIVTLLKPAKPIKPIKPPEPTVTPPLVKPRTIQPPAPKPATPAVAAASNRIPRRPERTSTSTATPRLDSAALLGQVASLEAETQRRASAEVRNKRVNPNDTQSLEGFYIAAWVRKVEQIGEMNFPSVARTLNLTTGPVLDVTLRADGSLQEVRVVRSSGHPELDRAAQQIVRLGAPYALFPPALRQRYDLLQISRPWRFDPGGRMQAR